VITIFPARGGRNRPGKRIVDPCVNEVETVNRFDHPKQ